MKKHLINEEELLNVSKLLIEYHRREIQKVYPDCNNMEEVKQENDKKVQLVENTINKIGDIVNTHTKYHIFKSEPVKPLQDIKVMDIREEYSKYEDLERKFIEKYNLHIKKLSDKLLLKLLNYCLTFKTVILVQGEEATVQILKYFVENTCNVKGILE